MVESFPYLHPVSIRMYLVKKIFVFDLDLTKASVSKKMSWFKAARARKRTLAMTRRPRKTARQSPGAAAVNVISGFMS